MRRFETVLHALWRRASTEQKCVNVGFAGTGEACGVTVSGDGVTLCTADGLCKKGICMAAAPDGGACDVQHGPLCSTPAKCIVGADGVTGVCKIRNASDCG